MGAHCHFFAGVGSHQACRWNLTKGRVRSQPARDPGHMQSHKQQLHIDLEGTPLAKKDVKITVIHVARVSSLQREGIKEFQHLCGIAGTWLRYASRAA